MNILYKSEENDCFICEETKNGETYVSYRPRLNYIHSGTYINSPLKDQVSLTYIAPVLIHDVKNILVLGAGAGENIRQLKTINEDYNITAIDIDSSVFNIAEKYFNISSNSNLKFICDDAYEFVKNSSDKFDYIIVDVYKTDSIPIQCIKKEFFEQLYRILNTDGMFIMNTNYNLRFNEISKKNNILSKIQKNIYESGFKSIFHNDINNMGIQYVFKNEITMDELFNKACLMYDKATDKDLKAALGGMALSTYEINKNEILSNEEGIEENSAIGKRQYYSKKILKLTRYYIANKAKIDQSNELMDITIKYLFNQTKNAQDSAREENVWYDLLNIDSPEYYIELFNAIEKKEYVNFDEIKKYVSFPNVLDMTKIKHYAMTEKSIFLWNYIYSCYLLKNDMGQLAVEYLDCAIEYVKTINKTSA